MRADQRVTRAAERDVRLVMAGPTVAELWSGAVLVGLVHVEAGGVVLRLTARARGPVALDAAAFERALADAREHLVGRCSGTLTA